MSKRNNLTPDKPKSMRCAIYTRKSSEEGLQQDFNSLDAQRESAEAYISAQKNEGWICLSDRYDDGGFSGGNMDRPALKRLLLDIEAGKIDGVIVYKVDRLSRSLLDFARVMDIFERHGVAFISITQQIDSSHSMGRLTLNMLLSFAQFEREIISERTRDKIAATRRKGKFSGGRPLLGYDIVNSPAGAKLIVNPAEAEIVRGIYIMYVEHQALIATLKAIEARGWTTKQWTTRKGTPCGGSPFDKASLYRLLTSRLYLGQVSYKGEVHPGEHAAIVEKALWNKVQSLLSRNGSTKGATVKNKHGALLRGLVHCSGCRCGMTHTYTAKGNTRYRYYTCVGAQKRGWHTCHSKSISAGQIESFVVQQIKRIGRDPALLEGTLRQMRSHHDRRISGIQAQLKVLERQAARLHSQLEKRIASPNPASDRLAEVNDQIREAEQKGTVLQQELQDQQRQNIDRDQVAAALSAFDPAWEQLSPNEQARVMQLLIERIDYDGTAGTIAITFHPSGIQTLAHEQEMAA